MVKNFWVGVAIVFFWAVCGVRGNLIINGDFELGKGVGYTSEYTWYSYGAYPFRYGIGTDPQNWDIGFQSFGDHTSESGNMMLIDASGGASGGAGRICWSETVAIAQNTNYVFSAWIAQIYLNGIYSNVQFEINGGVLGDYDVPTNTTEWRQFTQTWYSGSATTATIVIRETTGNNNSPGNDFALDDITFVPEPATILMLGIGALGLIRRK